MRKLLANIGNGLKKPSKEDDFYIDMRGNDKLKVIGNGVKKETDAPIKKEFAGRKLSKYGKVISLDDIINENPMIPVNRIGVFEARHPDDLYRERRLAVMQFLENGNIDKFMFIVDDARAIKVIPAESDGTDLSTMRWNHAVGFSIGKKIDRNHLRLEQLQKSDMGSYQSSGNVESALFAKIHEPKQPLMSGKFSTYMHTDLQLSFQELLPIARRVTKRSEEDMRILQEKKNQKLQSGSDAVVGRLFDM